VIILIFGYIRVSSREQNEDRQVIALKEFNIPEENLYIDKQSGKDFDRKEYKRLIKRIREDDLIIIKSIDRLGRNYNEILEQWRLITKVKKADIFVIDMPILNTRRGKDLMGTFLSDVVLQLLSYVAENERVNIRQRQAEGIAAAKARGVKFGRPRKAVPKNFYSVHKKWRNKEISLITAAKECNLPKSTFFDKAQAFEKNQKNKSLKNMEKSEK